MNAEHCPATHARQVRFLPIPGAVVQPIEDEELEKPMMEHDTATYSTPVCRANHSNSVQHNNATRTARQ